MAFFNINENHTAGFIYDSIDRAELLAKQGYNLPKPRQTGTTICGVIFRDGVVMGADTRATEEHTVSDKNSVKIHFMQDNIFCCGAGTAADTEMTTKLIASQLKLHKFYTERDISTKCASQLLKQLLYQYRGRIGAALVLGGVDENGPQLYSIHAHGSTDSLPFTSMGSGSLTAIAYLEEHFKPDMTEKEAKDLICRAVRGGILNDLASGSNIDLCVIRKDNCNYLRSYEEVNEKGEQDISYVYPKGTTAFRRIEVEDVDIEEQIEVIPPVVYEDDECDN